jgi:N-acetylglucosamine-6-phosphate deacetylase
MRQAGRIVAIGHASVDFDVVAAAAEAGAVLSTHLGNGLPQVLPKLANPLFAQLAEDRLTASFIADGIHLPPPALKVLIRAKGVERSVLVTDAVAAAASPPGLYDFAGMRIEHAADGSVRVPGGRVLAGSALTMDAAVRNVVSWRIASADEALRMAGDQPRALLAGVASGIAAGTVEWTPALAVRRVAIGGIERSFGKEQQRTRETGR